MGALSAEFLKLKRSLLGAVVIALPAAAVLIGAVPRLLGGTRPEQGWDTIWLQSMVFWGLLPFAIGAALIAALVWRVEHQGGNATALMTSPASTASILLAKTVVIWMLITVMQLVLLGTTLAVGTWGSACESRSPPSTSRSRR